MDRWLEILANAATYAADEGYREWAEKRPEYLKARELLDRAEAALEARLDPDTCGLAAIYGRLRGICSDIETEAAFWAGVKMALLFVSLAGNPAAMTKSLVDDSELEDWRRILDNFEARACEA